jgi:deoxyuridine 5''-triphosphate nucleotidohydrolase (dut)
VTSSRLGQAGGPGRPVQVLWTRLDPDLPAPQREHPGDAGWDLRSRSDVDLGPGQRALIATGVAIALPPGYVGLVHPRSGLAAREGFTLLNAPGTIDAGYRGEIAVIGINTDTESVVRISRGQRIAQLLVQEVCALDLVEVDSLPGSDRGGGGFGSTGTH